MTSPQLHPRLRHDGAAAQREVTLTPCQPLHDPDRQDTLKRRPNRLSQPASNFLKPQPRQIRMLLLQQGMHQRFVNLDVFQELPNQ